MRRTTWSRLAPDEASAADRRRAPNDLVWTGACCFAALAIVLTPGAAAGGEAFVPFLGADPTRDNPAGLAVLIGLVLFATFTSILHLIGRRQWARREKALTAELSQTHARLDRANLFLSTDPQIVVAWGSTTGEPDVEGEYSLVTDAPLPRRVLGFGSWLAPELAQKLDQAVERLRQRGESFSITVASLSGRHFDVEGRAIAGRAVAAFVTFPATASTGPVAREPQWTPGGDRRPASHA